MNHPFRLGLALLGALALSVVRPADAPAQTYPARPITMIVPFAVGGLTDVPARILAAMLQERIGQNIIVENKPGGSGTLGGAYAARAGVGDLLGQIRGRPVIDAGRRDVFGICLTRREDVLIRDANGIRAFERG